MIFQYRSEYSKTDYNALIGTMALSQPDRSEWNRFNEPVFQDLADVFRRALANPDIQSGLCKLMNQLNSLNDSQLAQALFQIWGSAPVSPLHTAHNDPRLT
jgi:hypothetical protein